MAGALNARRTRLLNGRRTPNALAGRFAFGERVAGYAEPGWAELVEQYAIQFFLVRPERAITTVLMKDPAWDLVYFDYNAVVFVRAGANTGIRRLEVISPAGNRQRGIEDKDAIAVGIDEMRYLLEESPGFFGGHKVLAFLLYRSGDYAGAMPLGLSSR